MKNKTSPRVPRLAVTAYPRKEKTPVVLVNIGSDKIGRGDTSGRVGIGKALARMLKGIYLYADKSTLPESPESSPDYRVRLTAMVKPHGKADFVLGEYTPPDVLATGCQVMDDVNECMSSSLLSENTLVAHNLTPAILDEGARAFTENYPGVKKTVIAVLMAAIYKDEDFCNKLASIAAAHGQATIFLCGCSRTDKYVINHAEEEINKNLVKNKTDQSVDVIPYHYKENDPLNPYRGLIALADHFVVWGESNSLMSEPLVRGRAIFVNQTGAPSLIKDGRAIPFDSCNPDEPFPVRAIPPVDITEDMARAIINKRKESLRKQCAEAFYNQRSLSAHEKKFLTVIAADAAAITRAPAPYKASTPFIKAAVAINPDVMKYISPAARTDWDLAARTMIKKIQNHEFFSPAFMTEKAVALRILERVRPENIPEIFRLLQPRIQNDRDICHRAARRNNHTIVYMNNAVIQDLCSDEEFALAALMHHAALFRKIPKEMQEDPAFITKSLAANRRVYQYLPATEQLNIKYATTFFSDPCNSLGALDPEVLDNEDIARIAISSNSRNARYLSDRLKNDPAFYLSLPSLGSRNIIESASPAVRDNTRVMLRAVSQSPLLMKYASSRLNESPTFMLYAARQGVARGMSIHDMLLSDALWNRPAFAVNLLRLDPSALNYMPTESKCYYMDNPAQRKELVLRIVTHAPNVSQHYLPYWVRADKDFASAYSEKHPNDPVKKPMGEKFARSPGNYNLIKTYEPLDPPSNYSLGSLFSQIIETQKSMEIAQKFAFLNEGGGYDQHPLSTPTLKKQTDKDFF